MTNRTSQLRFLLVLIVVTLFLSFFIIKPFLTTLTISLVFAVILQPVYKSILHRFKNNEALSASITVVVSILCILTPSIFVGARIFSEAVQLYNSITQGDSTQNMIITVLRSMGHVLNTFVPGAENYFINLSNNIDIYIKQGLTWLIHNLGNALSGISTILLHLFIFFISLYYLLKDGPQLKQAIIKLSPLNSKYNEIIFERLGSAINSVKKEVFSLLLYKEP